VIDLNNLKLLNNRLGQEKRERLIGIAVDVLLSAARKTDKVYKTSDELFLVLSPACPDISEKLETRISAKFSAKGINASIAISWKSQSELLYDLFYQDELLLLSNKSNLINDRVFFGPHNFSRPLPTKISKFECKIDLAADLDFAIQKQEFSLVYQPIYNSLREIIWCEVFVRWQRKKDGEYVPPGIFIPLAETNNKIHDIWSWSFETALAQLREWRTHSYQLPKLSFNFSPSQADFSKNTQFSYAEQITNWCKAYNFSSRDFLIELTETSLLKDFAAAVDLFEDLRSIGVRLCLDDFGAGFSSLSMLRFLPVSTIKIDRSFLVGLPDSVPNRAIVKATIALASELRINVVAEGVENEQQFRFLKNLGCDYFQGYFFAEPISSDVLEELLVKN